MTWIDQHIHYKHKISIDVSLQIHKNYVKHIERLNKDILKSVEDHKTNLDQFQKDKIQDLQKINKDQSVLTKKLEQDKLALKETYEDKLKKLEQQLKREISQFEKEKATARKLYQEQSNDIEKEKKDTQSSLETNYKKKIEDVNLAIENFQKEKTEALIDNDKETQTVKDANDQTYLTIKNNYHLLTTQFNTAINKLKKAHDKAKNTLKKEHQKKIDPVHAKLEELNTEYQQTVDKTKKDHQQQLLDLDEAFNVQKTTYEEKKQRIVHQSNETITLLNSKLSAFREAIHKEKIIQSRAYREKMKHADDPHVKEKINHNLTSVLRGLDNDLNKQILRTQKDITMKQKELQQKLYQHDINHLKEMNDWRLKRDFLAYDYKQDIAKIDLNFNHNLLASKKHLNLLEETYKYQLHVLNMTLKNDLLRLEIQLQIQSHIQERELNLLNNDQHLASYLSKLKTAEIEHDYACKIEKENVKAIVAKLDFESETQFLQISTQLELEKMKSKRDFTISEQDMRREIAESVFEKNKHQIFKTYTLSLEEAKHKDNLNLIDKKYQVELIKLDQQRKHHEQEFLLLEKKTNHQKELSNQKAIRLMKLYLNDLNLRQYQSEMLFYGLRLFYKKHKTIQSVIKTLYLLPSHPEIFKKMLNHLNDLEQVLKDGITQMINEFKSIDLEYYQKKIDDQTSYKYMLKHEDAMNLYEQELQKIHTKQKDIQKDINLLEQKFFQTQQALEKQNQFVIQLQKINDNIASGVIPAKHKHHDMKENQKLILNHEKEIKNLKHRLSTIEKQIDKKHQKMLPYDKQVDHIKESMEKQQKLLKKHQTKESNFYLKYQLESQHLHEKIQSDFDSLISAHLSFIENLNDTAYVTDSLLYQEDKKLKKAQMIFENHLINNQQQMLNHMFDFYHASDKKQDDIVEDFNKAQEHLLNELKSNQKQTMDQLDSNELKIKDQKEKDLKTELQGYKEGKDQKNQELEKSLATIQATIKQLDIKLQGHLEFMKQELKSLNDNQTQVANQSFADYKKQMEHIEAQYQKHVQKYDQHLELENKTYQNFLQSTENKNQGLLTRFEQTRLKTLDTFKQKNIAYDEDMKKSKLSIDKAHKNNTLDLQSLNSNRAHEIRNMNEHTTKYHVKAQKLQQRVLRQELKHLRKNYRFKIKSLHLK
ncbi:hypothetical protein BK010_05075 [Tenericutes bacterium MO-XQ]|nr:hypothetical protein BK010_05075 [Tenericutes bacterium MO-XQ]